MSNDNYVNTGEFFDKHPGVIKGVSKYQSFDTDGNLLEYWERDENGYMVDMTERKLLEIEIEKAEKELDKYIAEDVAEYGDEES